MKLNPIIPARWVSQAGDEKLFLVLLFRFLLGFFLGLLNNGSHGHGGVGHGLDGLAEQDLLADVGLGEILLDGIQIHA